MTVKGMTHEIWPTALIVSMLILIGISGHTVRDVDAALNIHNDLLRPLEATRSPDVDVVTTSYMLDGRDDGWIDELDHLKLIGDDYIQVTDKELGYLASIPSSYDSLFTDTNARSIQIYEGIIYLAYITLSFNPSALHYNLFTSDDGGGSWNMPVEVHSVAGLSEGSAEIYLYQDKIFYLMMMDSNNANLRGAEIKVANYLGWQNLPSAESKIVDTDYPEETKIIGYRDEVLLFEKDNGYGSVGFWRYNNGSWTGRYNMLGSHHMCPIVGDIGDGEMIYLFFTYPSSPDNIYKQHSSDGGRSWSTMVKVASSPVSINRFSGTFSQGRFHLACTFSASINYDLGYFCYNGTSGSLEVIDAFSSNGLDSDQRELMITSDGLDVTIGVESGTGTVTLVTSWDSGNNFHREATFGSGEAHCISLDEGRNLFAFMNGSDMELYKWSPAPKGNLFTTPLSPIAVSSWDSFGFDLGGIQESSSFAFRVLSRDRSTQYYPSNGMLDLDTLSEGSFGGYTYSHVGNFSGSFSSGGTVADSIVIEIEMTRGSTMNPILFGMIVNFTVEYPFNETFHIPGHLVLLDNCTMTEDGIQLDPGRSYGEVIIGPFQKETTFTDHLYGMFSFLDGGNYATIDLLGSGLQPIPGFTSVGSERIMTSDEVIFVDWGRNDIFDLPASIEEFNIRISIVKVGSSTPRIGWIELGASESPRVLGASLSEETIYRGGSTEIHISVYDREDPPDHLHVEVEAMDPAGGVWSREQVSDPYWNGYNWTSLFITDYQSSHGEVRIRAWATDGVGLTSKVLEFITTINVQNNVPLPPMVYLTPEHPRTGEMLSVHPLRGGSDLETAEQDLLYNVYVSRDGEIVETLLNMTVPDHLFEECLFKEGEEWNVSVTTWDGANESSPFKLGLVVENSAPYLAVTPMTITLDEDAYRHEVAYVEWFDDVDGEELTFRFSISSWIALEEIGGALYLTPSEDMNGPGFLSFDITDGTENLTVNLSLVVEPINDPPIWNDVGEVWVNEGEWVEVDIDAFDPRDGEDVTVENNILAILPTLIPGVNLITYPNGNLKLRPTNDMVGTFNITYIIKDDEYTFTRYLTLTINNTNQDPSIPELTIFPDLLTFIEGDIIQLSASSSDPDERWGDELTFSWHSDIQGDLGSGEELNISLTVGTHLITLTVMDSMGAQNSTDVELTVLPAPIKEKDVIRTWALYTITGISGLITGLIVAVIIFILARSGKKKKEDEEKDEAPGEKRIEAGPPPPDKPKLGEAPRGREALNPAPEKQASTSTTPPPSTTTKQAQPTPTSTPASTPTDQAAPPMEKTTQVPPERP